MAPDDQRIWYKEARSAKYFFHRQFLHLLSLLILLPVAWSFAAPVMTGGSWMGIMLLYGPITIVLKNLI